MRGISCRLSPIPDHAFFEQTVLKGQVGHDLLQGGGLPTQVLHLVRGGGPRRVASETLLAGLQELLRPAVVPCAVRGSCAASSRGRSGASWPSPRAVGRSSACSSARTWTCPRRRWSRPTRSAGRWSPYSPRSS